MQPNGRGLLQRIGERHFVRGHNNHLHDKAGIVAPFDVRWVIFRWLDIQAEEYCRNVDEHGVVCDVPAVRQS